MRKVFIVLTVPFFLIILIKAHAGSPKSYKLSLIGEKNWAEVNELKLPKEEKKELLYKSNVLYAAHNRYQPDHVVAFSSNGKFKVEMRRTDKPLDEDLGVASIFDSLGNKLLEEEIPGNVLLSNNGDDFVTKGLTVDIFSFHKISKGKPTFHKRAPGVYTRYGFSADGRYFIGAGSSLLDLLTAEGDVLWRKNTNSPAPRELAFSYNADKVALALMPHLLGWQEPKLTDIKDSVPTGTLDSSLKNAFLFIFNRKGEVLHQAILDLPVIHQMTFSPKGDFLAVGGYNRLSIFDVNAKNVIGKYGENSINFSYCCMVFSPRSDLLAIQSYRNLYLLNLKGEITDYAELSGDFDTNPAGSTLAFSESGKILLASTKNKLYAFKIEEK